MTPYALKTVRLAVLLIATMPSAVRADAARPPVPVERSEAVVRPLLARELSIVLARSTAPLPTPASRDLANAALGVLALGQQTHQAETYLRQLFDAQDSDPKSTTYGDIPWQIGRREISDDTAVAFAMQAVGPIFAGYSDRLSPGFKDDMKPHVEAALASLERRDTLLPSYTSVYLMRVEALILCGEQFGDDAAASRGRKDLDAWIAFTASSGIHEFDSPTYYAIDLASMGAGYRYAQSPQTRAQFRKALDYFWSDICANYFPGRQDLSGPHSRAADQLGGLEDIDGYLYLAGLRSKPLASVGGAQASLMLDYFRPGGYVVPPPILAMASLPERVVTSVWSSDPPRDRYNYITPGFSIGSASGDYGPQDKPIDVELASQRDLPTIEVVADSTDQPYGKLRTRDRSGHLKPHHLSAQPVCVQSKGALLALLRVEPPRQDSVQTLSVNIILPRAVDDLAFSGVRAPAAGEFVIPGKVGAVALARAGETAVAVRVFHADAAAGLLPSVSLKADPVGIGYGAARLAVYLYAGGPRRLPSRPLKVGLLIVAARCPGAASAAALASSLQTAVVDDVATKSDWTVTATLDRPQHARLAATIDLSGSGAALRSVNGAPIASQRLGVNGEEIAGAILGPSAASQP